MRVRAVMKPGGGEPLAQLRRSRAELLPHHARQVRLVIPQRKRTRTRALIEGANLSLMSIWGRIFAAGYDRFMAGTEKATLRRHRQALIPRASGHVLEIGGGTGANLPFYGGGVETLTVTEPEAPMARRLERRLREIWPAAKLAGSQAEDLPFEDDSFDVAVSTLVLCTVHDQPRALRELHRVLKPGGRLLFIEHVRSDDTRLARWQDRLNGLQRRIGHGCNCNRPTVETIRGAGFEIVELEQDVLKKVPPHVRPLVVGVAEANGQPAD
jgi:ubiquinone/menaquinone biosynthesis C-methylase UbiE